MIGSYSLKAIHERLNGCLSESDVSFAAISIDTRTLMPGALFIAIKGPNFDGHEFVPAAQGKGAVAALVSDAVETKLPLLTVTDTREALGQLGALNRDLFEGGVLAITGSAGKTTVKEMSTAILKTGSRVLSTRGNFNNEIGVPLTLLEISNEHEFAVMELGASSIGEIEYTASLVRPDVAVITNAAEAHIEGFGSLNNVVQAKGEIIDGLRETGVAVINSDDLNAYKWLQRAAGKNTYTFSLDADAGTDFYATDIQELANGTCHFEMVTPMGKTDIELRQLGRHNIGNALAAAAGTMSLGADLKQVKAGLEATQPVEGRLTSRIGLNGARIIDDSYNANPESLRAAIDVLVHFEGRKVLVLGDMAELGDNALNMHIESGRYALNAGVDALFSLGALSVHAAREFKQQGFSFDDRRALIAELSQRLDKNTTVLIKGSRSARMELVVKAVTEAQAITGGDE